MDDGSLMGRVLLELPAVDEADIGRQLSAVALAPDGVLWVAGDESGASHAAVTGLQPVSPVRFTSPEAYALDGYVELFNLDDEADFEGLDIDGGYLWFVGSHSLKRSKPKGKSAAKDVERLSEIVTEQNRFLLGRVPIAGGKPQQTCNFGDGMLKAARLSGEKDGNALTKLLRKDDHLGSLLIAPLAAKENGFDIEGLAVRGERVFVGLRGPVLNGFAIVLELSLADDESTPDRLKIVKPANQRSRVRKYFLDLNGLGVRDLAFDGDDHLLVLAGATMTLDAPAAVYRLNLPAATQDTSGDTLVRQQSGNTTGGAIERLFTLPVVPGADKAEGLVRMVWDERPAVMIVFDGPSAARIVDGVGVYADVYALP